MANSQNRHLGESVNTYVEEFGEVDIPVPRTSISSRISFSYEHHFHDQSGCASDSTTEPEILDFSEGESTGGEKINEQPGNVNPGSETRQRKGFQNKKLNQGLPKRKGIKNQKLDGGVVRSPENLAGKDTQISQPCVDSMPLPKWWSLGDDIPIETFQLRLQGYISTTEALQNKRGNGVY